MSQIFVTYLYEQKAKITAILESLELITVEDDPPTGTIVITVEQEVGLKRIR